MTAYYRDALGLEELSGDDARTATDLGAPGARAGEVRVLGRGRDALVVLVHTPGLPAPAPGQAGLFHTALLFPDRAALADVVARAFYVDALGFEVTAEWSGALFVSAGGYHHHMAMNSWGSRGAGARAATIGLGQVSVVVPTAQDVDALAERLRRHGVAARHDGRTLRFEDPWRSLLEVSAAG